MEKICINNNYKTHTYENWEKHTVAQNTRFNMQIRKKEKHTLVEKI